MPWISHTLRCTHSFAHGQDQNLFHRSKLSIYLEKSQEGITSTGYVVKQVFANGQALTPAAYYRIKLALIDELDEHYVVDSKLNLESRVELINTSKITVPHVIETLGAQVKVPSVEKARVPMEVMLKDDLFSGHLRVLRDYENRMMLYPDLIETPIPFDLSKAPFDHCIFTKFSYLCPSNRMEVHNLLTAYHSLKESWGLLYEEELQKKFKDVFPVRARTITANIPSYIARGHDFARYMPPTEFMKNTTHSFNYQGSEYPIDDVLEILDEMDYTNELYLPEIVY